MNGRIQTNDSEKVPPNSTPQPSYLNPVSGVKAPSTRKSLAWLFFAAIVVAFLGVLGAPMDFQCRRIELGGPINCIKQTRLLWIVPLPQQSIVDVRGAQVSESSGYEGGATFRVELLTGYGTVPLTNGYTSGELAKEEFAGQVNDFVRSAAPGTLAVTDPGLLSLENVFSSLVWLLFAVAGSYMWGKIKMAFGRAWGKVVR